ncbi:MAG: hypothetical protein GY898_30045 [Proteobacteria bacterium]|nr:hypothetical protein [Pseudomonadota bacterium]
MPLESWDTLPGHERMVLRDYVDERIAADPCPLINDEVLRVFDLGLAEGPGARSGLRTQLAQRELFAALVADPENEQRLFLLLVQTRDGPALAGLGEGDTAAVCGAYQAKRRARSLWAIGEACVVVRPAQEPASTPAGPRDFLREIEAMEAD